MKPKYLTKEETVKDKSLKQEKRVQRQLASGALDFHKGDLLEYLDKNKTLCYELKLSVKGKSVSVTKIMLEKIFREASIEGKLPIMLIEIDKYILIGEVIRK